MARVVMVSLFFLLVPGAGSSLATTVSAQTLSKETSPLDVVPSLAATAAAATGAPDGQGGAAQAEKPPSLDNYVCFRCHTDMEDERLTPPAKEWSQSVHREAGVMCQDCHGGDPNDKDNPMDPERGFRGAPDKKGVAEMCAKCHSDGALMRKYNKRADQDLLYSGSVHGHKVARGDKEAPTCTDCHGKHAILRVKDPRSSVHRNNVGQTCGGCHARKDIFEKRRKPHNQLALYKKSYHYKLFSEGDLLVPTCVDCHSSHAVLPARSERVQTVCFNCHAAEAELYKGSPHYQAYKDDGEPVCIHCHGNHDITRPTIAKFTDEGDRDCIACHDEESDAYKTGLGLQQAIGASQDSLKHADSELQRIIKDGHGGFEFSSLQERLTKAKENMRDLLALPHRLDVERVKKDSDKVIKTAQLVSDKVEGFWKEIGTRKIGLVVAWLIFIGLAGTLLAWIRIVERKRERE